jgi:flagellar M-ring protein FliF
VVHSSTPRGQVKKLSIAVLVADPAAPALEDGTTGAAPEPWSEEQLKRFEELARQAVGFDEKRGDRITVTNAPFRGVDAPASDGAVFALDWLPLAESLLRGGLVLAAVLLFARLVVKPALGAFGSGANRPPALTGGAAPNAGASQSAPTSARAGELGSGFAGSAPSVAIAPPSEGVKALRAWLSQG